MPWTMPTDRQLGNIIYNATNGLRQAGSPFAAAVRNSRIAQGITIINRVRQEVGEAPGWGTGHGTESAGVTSSANPGILAECHDAARAAIARCAHLAVASYALDPTVFYFHELYLYGAQYYGHYFEPPPIMWQNNHNTHLVASWGPFQDVARCIERHGRRPVCRGYLGVYVNFRNLGNAFASQELNCAPHQVPPGAVKARNIESARRLPWMSLMRRNPPLR